MMRQMMNWKMLDLAVRRLNVFALKEWKSTFLMKATVYGMSCKETITSPV